jgi:hypothetical protein
MFRSPEQLSDVLVITEDFECSFLVLKTKDLWLLFWNTVFKYLCRRVANQAQKSEPAPIDDFRNDGWFSHSLGRESGFTLVTEKPSIWR